MNQTRCLLSLGRKGIALITVIAVLYSQILPAYAMQEGDSDDEQEPPAHKRARGSPPADLKHNNIIDDYVERLYRAANQEEADPILENIPPHDREEVINRVEQKNNSTSSSSSSLSFNVKLPEKVEVDYCLIEDDFKPEGENKLSFLGDKAEHIKSGKRKRGEDKDKLPGTDGEKNDDPRYINRAESLENLFGILPFEIQVKVLKFVEDPHDIANSRLVSHQIKNVRDTHIPYHLSLPRLAALGRLPESFTGKKLCLRGWAPDLASILSLLPPEPCEISGHIFFSNTENNLKLPQGLKAIPQGLKPTLTVSNDGQANSKREELQEQDLSNVVHIRSRKALWNDLVKSDFMENYAFKKQIIDSEVTLSPILDIDNGKLLKTIIAGCLLKKHVMRVISAFNKILVPEQRLHVASLLSEKILARCQNGEIDVIINALAEISSSGQRFHVASLISDEILAHCKDGYQIKVIIEALSKISSPEQCAHIASLLNEKILSRFKNKVDGAIYAFARIHTPEQRFHIASLLNERILARCQNGGGGAIIDALADISSPEERAYIALILSEKTLARCKDGIEVSVIINALAHISNLNQLIYVASLLKEELPSQCQNGYQIANEVKRHGRAKVSKYLSKVYRN